MTFYACVKLTLLQLSYTEFLIRIPDPLMGSPLPRLVLMGSPLLQLALTGSLLLQLALRVFWTRCSRPLRGPLVLVPHPAFLNLCCLARIFAVGATQYLVFLCVVTVRLGGLSRSSLRL